MNFKSRELSIEEMGEANRLLQKLVDGVSKRQSGKGGINAFEAYDLIDKIHKIINKE